jgi:hypothetical protein
MAGPCVLGTGFALDCRDSIGGVDEIWVGELDGIDFDTLTVVDGAVTVMAMAGLKLFYNYKLRRNTSEAKADFAGEVNAGSGYIMHQVDIQLDRFDVATRNEIRVLGKKPLVFIVKDKNGLLSVYGLYHGLDLATGTAGTGKEAASLNGFALSFTGEEADFPQGISQSIVDTLIV